MCEYIPLTLRLFIQPRLGSMTLSGSESVSNLSYSFRSDGHCPNNMHASGVLLAMNSKFYHTSRGFTQF